MARKQTVTCDDCGAQEVRDRECGIDPMISVAIPLPTGRKQFFDFCDGVCLARWSAIRATRE